MRRLHIYIVTITAIIMLLVCCVCANAETVQVSEGVTGGYIYFDTETGAITDCDTEVTMVVIPDIINNVTVTTIKYNAFRGCTNLTNITIPNSVTSIGSEAFRECISLASITIPNNVTAIAAMTFYECTSLVSITLPNSVKAIGYDTFYGCASLVSITLPNGITGISTGTFDGCTSLASITIPNSITSIGYGAFRNCTGLTSITIPDNVTIIGGSAFLGCTGLKNIIIPNSVTTKGTYVFYGCSSLRSVKFYNEQISIVEEDFYGCSDELVLYGYVGSTTESYATTYGYKFMPINSDASLSGIVSGYQGNEEIRITAVEVGNETNHREVVADKGTYQITDLESGTYNVTVSCKDCVSRLYTAEIIGDTTQDVCIYQIGDIDMNGEIAAADVTRMARHIAKIQKIDDEYCHKLMDTDKNGEVEAADVTHLARYIAKLINTL